MPGQGTNPGGLCASQPFCLRVHIRSFGERVAAFVSESEIAVFVRAQAGPSVGVAKIVSLDVTALSFPLPLLNTQRKTAVTSGG